MNTTVVLHDVAVPAIGRLSIEAFNRQAHVDIAHRWLASDHARFWGMRSMSRGQIEAYFRDVEASNRVDAFIGRHDDRPAFLVERYAPEAEDIGDHYAIQPGDIGMHLLVAPPERPIHGFTWAVFHTVMTFLFADPGVARVIVEPDVDNAGIHALNRRAGFVYHRRVELPGKTAWFATCRREDFAAACAREPAQTSNQEPLR